MYACLSHALSTKVDRDRGVEATVPYGPENVGYAICAPLNYESQLTAREVTAERKIGSTALSAPAP